MKLKLVLLALSLLLLSLMPAIAGADELDPDSVILLTSRPDIDEDTLIVELYFWVDGDTINGGSMGFTWDNPNFQLVSSTVQPAASTAFLTNILYPSDNIDSANYYQRFQFVCIRLFTPGLHPSTSRQHMATFKFTMSSWTGADSLAIDTLTWNSGVNFKLSSATGADIFPVLNMGNSLNNPLVIKPISGVDEDNTGLPKTYALNQNYPNPFNPVTTIEFDLPKKTDVSLTIYNVLGQKVDELKGTDMIGHQLFEWDASRFASGIYFYKLETNEFVDTKKMVLLK
ncbi:MAG: T9SS type A sorting domain-containing protein [Candidatus Zixiibacteriota bacterium]